MTTAPPQVPGRVPMRVGPVSGVWRPRSITVTILGAAVLVIAIAANIALGDFPISVGDVLGVLAGGGSGGQRFIVLELRLPRALTGALIGAALGASGAILQTITRNPLASPDVLGVMTGAGAAALTVIVVGSWTTISGWVALIGLPMAALFGGLGAAALLYALAWRRGLHGFRLVLVGIGLNLVFTAVIQWLLIAGDVYEAARAAIWLNGSLNARGWEHVIPVAVALVVLIPLALVLTFQLDALHFGDDVASGLGVRVTAARAGLLAVSVALAAVATAAAGPIAFVALVSPQIALRLVRSSRPPIAAGMTLGAALTVTADLVARTAWGGAELPVGIVTAVLGAPYLLFLLVRNRREVRA